MQQQNQTHVCLIQFKSAHWQTKIWVFLCLRCSLAKETSLIGEQKQIANKKLACILITHEDLCSSEILKFEAVMETKTKREIWIKFSIQHEEILVILKKNIWT